MNSTSATTIILIQVTNLRKKLFIYLFILFYFEQYLFRGAQFSEAGLNGALIKTK